MIRDLLFGLGFVAIVEGLVLALAPGRLDQVVEMLSRIGPDQRRVLGLFAVAAGTGLLWLARS